MPIITDITLDEWISLGETRCTSISAIAMREPPVEEEDMPLDSAIYESGRDKIFAARGGYVYLFNASSGAKEASAKFDAPAFGDSYITYDSVRDTLFISQWFNYVNMDQTPNWRKKYLYEINPDTLAVVSSYIFDPALSFFGGTSAFKEGPRQLFANSGIIYGLFHTGSADDSRVYSFDPSTSTFTDGGAITTNGWARSDIVYDSVLDVFWTLRIGRAERWDRGSLTNVGPDVTIDANAAPRGAAYRSPSLYFVVGISPGRVRSSVYKKAIDNTGVVTAIDTTRPNAIPFNIKYRATTDRLYVPTTVDDTVVIIDPNTDTVESVKTGFDSPWDVVFTASKAFAVQHGNIGLKEIV